MPIMRERFMSGKKRYSVEDNIVRFLNENDDRAFTVVEVTEEVVTAGCSEANVPGSSFDQHTGYLLDITLVNSMLDSLVDNGSVRRRIVDAGDGARSYYSVP